jgi:hypothetical protein
MALPTNFIASLNVNSTIGLFKLLETHTTHDMYMCHIRCLIYLFTTLAGNRQSETLQHTTLISSSLLLRLSQ